MRGKVAGVILAGGAALGVWAGEGIRSDFEQDRVAQADEAQTCLDDISSDFTSLQAVITEEQLPDSCDPAWIRYEDSFTVSDALSEAAVHTAQATDGVDEVGDLGYRVNIYMTGGIVGALVLGIASEVVGRRLRRPV
ncbi:MAG: hypothetical protein KIH63_002195 [Candidatus Saccharibacteria bacterium]|nr:hypothetical protein [Candidatus Saccharibacteria bacterium]